MKSIKKIDIQDFMTSDEVTEIMTVLGGSDYALFVGGCVRNAILGEEVGDIDIATKWTPEQVTEKLVSHSIQVIPTGFEHGTVTAVVNKKPFEITTLRKDVETDGRRAVVSFTDSWLEDAQRRDFTMNTLLADQDGQVFDPIGKGVSDLEARRVIFVGDPRERIKEDYLRILRFFRFHAFYGQGDLDTAALQACSECAEKIAELSKERITQEFLKILSSDHPHQVVDVMFAHNVLKQLHFEDYDVDLLRDVCTFQQKYTLGFVASRLFALIGLQYKNIEAIQKFLLLPKVFLKDIEALRPAKGF